MDNLTGCGSECACTTAKDFKTKSTETARKAKSKMKQGRENDSHNAFMGFALSVIVVLAAGFLTRNAEFFWLLIPLVLIYVFITRLPECNCKCDPFTCIINCGLKTIAYKDTIIDSRESEIKKQVVVWEENGKFMTEQSDTIHNLNIEIDKLKAEAAKNTSTKKTPAKKRPARKSTAKKKK